MILYDLFNDKSMRDIELRYNEAFKLDCQLMFKEKWHTYIRYAMNFFTFIWELSKFEKELEE